MKSIQYIKHRRTNRSDLISHIDWKRQSDFCIMILCYNNVENIFTLIHYLQNEKNNSVYDLIIIDNSLHEQKELLNSTPCNTIVIRPQENLGSAWWYALGMEYILSQWYKYFTMIEDDIILLEQWTIDLIYNKKKEKQITFINACKNTWWEHSRYVQCACYPTSFIEKIWVINPTYFFRSEDLERKIRIEKWIKNLWVSKYIIDKNYLHPYLKRVNGTASRAYFSLRNQLLMLYEHRGWNLSFLITVFLYIWNSICRWIQGYGNQYIKAWFLALYDFTVWHTHHTNTIRIRQLSEKYLLGKNETIISYDSFIKNYNKFWILWSYYQFAQVDSKTLNISNNIYKFLSTWAIIWWRNCILFPLYSLTPKIISIDEFILWKKELYISNKSNKRIFWIIIFCISLLATIPISILVLIILLFIIILRNLWIPKYQ